MIEAILAAGGRLLAVAVAVEVEMNPNDKAMLEKVKPGWWIKSREAEKGPGGRSDDGWCLVVHSGQPSGPHVWRHR